jgi:outer membrane protein assembly factor BamB
MGPNRDGISQETGILKEWPEGGPTKVWTSDKFGLGYAGPAIVGERMYILGSRDGTTQLLAFNANSGEEIWALPLGPHYPNDWGDGPRSTPTVDGEFIYALSGTGILVCVRAASGEEVWRREMGEFGGRLPNWGYTESVLIDGDRLICTPGAEEGAIVALKKTTGELEWQAADLDDKADYSSIVIGNFPGGKQYVQLLPTRVVGLSPADGKLLWESGFPGRVAVIPTPLVHENYVYVTSGYGGGCKLVEIAGDNQATVVYENKLMKNHHGGVIRLGEYVYGYSDQVGWLCQKFMSGERVWREEEALEKGAIAYADGRFVLLGEKEGDVALIAASPDGWQEHGRFKLEPQSEQRSPKGGIWVHPVIANGKMYLRDQEMMSCYNVKE